MQEEEDSEDETRFSLSSSSRGSRPPNILCSEGLSRREYVCCGGGEGSSPIDFMLSLGIREIPVGLEPDAEGNDFGDVGDCAGEVLDSSNSFSSSFSTAIFFTAGSPSVLDPVVFVFSLSVLVPTSLPVFLTSSIFIKESKLAETETFFLGVVGSEKEIPTSRKLGCNNEELRI